MPRRLLMLLATLMLTACVQSMASAPYLRVPQDGNPAKDQLECQALAGQAAMGTRAWSRDPAFRAAFFANAKDQYYKQCLYSRGYRWIQP